MLMLLLPRYPVPAFRFLSEHSIPGPLFLAPGESIVYTYDVYWDTSDITWSSRWDAYLRMPGGKVRPTEPAHADRRGPACRCYSWACSCPSSTNGRMFAGHAGLPTPDGPVLLRWAHPVAPGRPSTPTPPHPTHPRPPPPPHLPTPPPPNHPNPPQVHWFSILNSLMVVVVMSCIVAMIMMRTIRRDLQRYEQLLVDGGERAAPG